VGQGSQRRAGVVSSDRRTHAVRRRWTGRRAMCGAGRIVFVFDRSFTVTDSGACRLCVHLVRQPER